MTASYPALNDHIFEWHDLIAMLRNANEPRDGRAARFNMLELGAGWAKWIVDAVGLARRSGLPESAVHAVGVEAQPGHCDMARQHIATNSATGSATILCGAVAATDGEVEFPVDTESARRGHGKFGYGVQMVLDGKRWGDVTKIKAYGICTLLRLGTFGGEPVDFVSLDVQSYEHAILAPAAETMACLDTWVRMIHISLHRAEENDARVLADTFIARLGWKLLRYLPLLTKSQPTAFGPLDFTDGIITFINPGLTPPALAARLYDRRNVHRGTYTQHELKVNATVPDWAPGDFIEP